MKNNLQNILKLHDAKVQSLDANNENDWTGVYDDATDAHYTTKEVIDLSRNTLENWLERDFTIKNGVYFDDCDNVFTDDEIVDLYFKDCQTSVGLFDWDLTSNVEAIKVDNEAVRDEAKDLETAKIAKAIKDAKAIDALAAKYSTMTIRDVWKESGLTQKEIAEILGVPLRTVESWIRGLSTPKPWTRETFDFKLAQHKYSH